MRRVWIAIAVLVFALGGGELLAGKGGGGKPPKDEPPPDPAIAFLVGSAGDLTVTNEDGSNRTVLLAATDGTLAPQCPTWSPDGSKLAFVFDDGTHGKGLYTLDVVVDGDAVYGENLNKIVSVPAGGPVPHCSWSPVSVFGKYRIAISMKDAVDGAYEVHLVNFDSDGTAELTNLGRNRGDISWSPTGDRLAVTPNHRSVKIHHLEQDGPGDPVYVGYSPRYDLYDGDELMWVWNVAWANTQDYVLAVSVGTKSAAGFPVREDLWIVDLRDGVLSPETPPAHIEVFVLDTYIELTSAAAPETYPTWSPDDSALLFSQTIGPKAGLYVFEDLTGNGNPVPFYKNRNVSSPDWRR